MCGGQCPCRGRVALRSNRAAGTYRVVWTCSHQFFKKYIISIPIRGVGGQVMLTRYAWSHQDFLTVQRPCLELNGSNVMHVSQTTNDIKGVWNKQERNLIKSCCCAAVYSSISLLKSQINVLQLRFVEKIPFGSLPNPCEHSKFPTVFWSSFT